MSAGHCQSHGLVPLGNGCIATINSEKPAGKKAIVSLHVGSGGFTLSAPMTPAWARVFAENLIAAADLADEVEAAYRVEFTAWPAGVELPVTAETFRYLGSAEERIDAAAAELPADATAEARVIDVDRARTYSLEAGRVTQTSGWESL